MALLLYTNYSFYSRFLAKQYRTQMKRRCQQIQEELVSIIYFLYLLGIAFSIIDSSCGKRRIYDVNFSNTYIKLKNDH